MKDTFCVLPYIHAVYNSYNSDKADCFVLPCCRYDFTYEQEDKNPHEPTKHSKLFKRLQDELSSGIQSKGCERCWKDESIGITSYRETHNERYADIIKSEEYKDKNLRFLEIVPSNACNLACLSCNSTNSSKWVPIDNFIASDGFRQNIKFTDWRTIDLSNLTELKLMGGEPMYLKDNLKLLKHLSEIDQLKNIKLLVITNLMNPLTDVWKSLFAECKEVEMCASIDAIGPLNDYIRAYSDWNLLEKNLHELLDFARTVNMSVFVNTVISIYNINKSLEIENYFKSLNIRAHQDLTSYPPHIDAKRLPLSVKKILLEKNCLSQTAIDNLTFMEEKKGIIEDFYKATVPLDQFHNRNFKDYNPELSEILGNYND